MRVPPEDSEFCSKGETAVDRRSGRDVVVIVRSREIGLSGQVFDIDLRFDLVGQLVEERGIDPGVGWKDGCIADRSELARLIVEADTEAELFRMHYAMLYDYGFKLSRQAELVRDSIQEVFAYLWERRAKIAVAESVRAYLLVSLRRQVLHALAQQRQRHAVYTAFETLEPREYFSPEDFLILQETEAGERLSLKRALQAIPPRMREALYLKTYNGLSYREIAGVMNVSAQVARNYVCEAMQRLREVLVIKIV